jgi:hypothetical protein
VSGETDRITAQVKGTTMPVASRLKATAPEQPKFEMKSISPSINFGTYKLNEIDKIKKSMRTQETSMKFFTETSSRHRSLH